MLDKTLSLRQMIDFKPTDEQMLSLPLDIVTYIKISIISTNSFDNYEFIRFLFAKELDNDFKDLKKTVIYDFENDDLFISIFELNALHNYENVSILLKSILEEYEHIADVIIDFYTHDSKAYRLSNLDAIVKLEQMQK